MTVATSSNSGKLRGSPTEIGHAQQIKSRGSLPTAEEQAALKAGNVTYKNLFFALLANPNSKQIAKDFALGAEDVAAIATEIGLSLNPASFIVAPQKRAEALQSFLNSGRDIASHRIAKEIGGIERQTVFIAAALAAENLPVKDEWEVIHNQINHLKGIKLDTFNAVVAGAQSRARLAIGRGHKAKQQEHL